ncbi:MAG: tetratricopeptide repeat protein, partial [Chloroflexota bacterium]|nr:tetratricopeptide repeat protein [Chloroflexota bacterium]
MADVALQSIFDEARRALDSGDADLAIGIVQHVLRYAPDVIEAHRLLGEAYLNAGQSEQAVAAFEAVLRADPENIAAYYGLGLAQQGLDRRMEAIHAFERALEIQPNLADLRTQLLQLYAETPGSAGQFRLSRSGLGRLYARGQMYAQAIDEFRAVLENEPDRDDVRVALAETLWRDGQEDEAADWCREIIRRQPELHKPTVILGYLQLAAGQPEGEALWRRAARQDPALQTAYGLFDILPPVQIAEPVIPAFDERTWREEQTRPLVEPPVEAVRVAVPSEDDITAPRQESMQAPVASPPQPRATAVLSDDDLLASLLGLDGEETTESELAPLQQPAPSSSAEDN